MSAPLRTVWVVFLVPVTTGGDCAGLCVKALLASFLGPVFFFTQGSAMPVVLCTDDDELSPGVRDAQS
jgi:hypothetical protein